MSLAHWLALARVLIAPAPSAAPELPLVLQWEAPEECPGADAVVALVTGVLHHSSPASLPEPLWARARVTRDGAGAWTLRLELDSVYGQRTRVLRAAECPLLARAAALVVAIQLDPGTPGRTAQAAITRAPDEPDEPAADPTPAIAVVPPPIAVVSPPIALVPPPPIAVAAPPPIAVAPRPAPTGPGPRISTPDPPRLDLARDREADALPPARARPGLVGHLRLEGGLELGLLPGPGGLLGLAGGLAVRGVRIELGLVGAPLRTTARQPGARLDRLAAALRVCPGWTDRRARVTLSGCVGAELGAIRAEGAGVAVPSMLWAPWAALTVGPAARVRVAGPLGLRLGVDAAIALARPQFTVGADTPVYRVTSPGLRVNVGLDLQFVARKRRTPAT